MTLPNTQVRWREAHYVNKTLKLGVNPDSKDHGANMGPTWVCRPQMGPMLAPWTLLSGKGHVNNFQKHKDEVAISGIVWC